MLGIGSKWVWSASEVESAESLYSLGCLLAILLISSKYYDSRRTADSVGPAPVSVMDSYQASSLSSRVLDFDKLV